MGVSISPALVNQLSTASTPGGSLIPANGKNITLAQLSPPGDDPSTVIDNALANITASHLQYPRDLGPYFFLMGISDYTKGAFNQTGQLNQRFFAALPFPQGMLDHHSVRYETIPLGTIMGAGSSAVLGAGGLDLTSLQGLKNAGAAIGGAAGGALAAEAVKGLGNLQQAIAAAGVVVNDFLTVMLQGPNYKTRSFSWKLSPKSAQEADDLRKIIQLLNDSMAPSISPTLGSAFFNWPRIFTPSFNYEGGVVQTGGQTFQDWVFYMKPSIIVDMSVNYTPNNVYVPTAQTRAPHSIELTIQFMELEFWLGSGAGKGPQQGDFKDGGPDMPAGTGVNIPNTIQSISQFIRNPPPPGTPTTIGSGG